MSEHRVASHLGVEASDYDRQIRRFIPAYDGADATVYPTGPEHARLFRVRSAGMATHGIGRGEADALFAKWAQEDTYQPLSVELAPIR